ncbi:MAG TPA: DUF1415 domain-containing protein [Burkholderiales bacterium]|nr:DUF1415 domain-containing protein [Burkholderiales bacterium]
MGGEVSAEQAVGATRAWIEKAVIGLGLCPFAAQPYALGRIRYGVSAARSPQALLQDLSRELRLLADADALRVETTLLIHPYVLGDFLDYNAFLDDAEGAVRGLGLEGVIQVASFHPRYRFADTGPDDIENYTNRSPYPMLHLLREESVERAVAAHPGTAEIYRRNVELLRRLGHEGWQRLFAVPGKTGRD